MMTKKNKSHRDNAGYYYTSEAWTSHLRSVDINMLRSVEVGRTHAPVDVNPICDLETLHDVEVPASVPLARRK